MEVVYTTQRTERQEPCSCNPCYNGGGVHHVVCKLL